MVIDHPYLEGGQLWKSGSFGHLKGRAIVYFLPFPSRILKETRKQGNYSENQPSRDILLPSCKEWPFSTIYRSFSVGIIQLLKESSKKQMSFIFYINNGFTTMAMLEQVQGYYQNIGNYYSSDQLYASSNCPPKRENENHTQCDTVVYTSTNQEKEEPQPQPPKEAPLAQKPKRRMEKTLEKEILSAKKNSQSNIINQFYSFFSSRQKSEKVVQKCASLLGKSSEQIQKILSTFYMTIRLINAKRGRKYVNVSMFLKFFTQDEFSLYLSEMREKIEQLDYLSVEELCEIFRRCAKYYLREVSVSAILTSKRISIVSKEEHLKKRRRILRTILGN